jgi:hypothetical protein
LTYRLDIIIIIFKTQTSPIKNPLKPGKVTVGDNN